MLELPVLDETKCSGCAECVDVCPAECLELRPPLPHLPRPGDCVSCGLCVLICPDGALRLGGEPD